MRVGAKKPEGTGLGEEASPRVVSPGSWACPGEKLASIVHCQEEICVTVPGRWTTAEPGTLSNCDRLLFPDPWRQTLTPKLSIRHFHGARMGAPFHVKAATLFGIEPPLPCLWRHNALPAHLGDVADPPLRAPMQ